MINTHTVTSIATRADYAGGREVSAISAEREAYALVDARFDPNVAVADVKNVPHVSRYALMEALAGFIAG